MINIENSIRGDETSSLGVFCRVDVGVLQTEDKQFHYYVNELERSLTVGLFRRLGVTSLTMLNSAVANIPQYIERSRVQ